MSASPAGDRSRVDDVTGVGPAAAPIPVAAALVPAVPVRIVDMRAADLPQVQRIEDSVFGDTAWTPPQWREELDAADERRRYVVLQTVDAPCRTLGYAGVWDTGGDADILTLAVSPAARRQGWGAALLQHLIEVAHQWRCRSLMLEVAADNAAAQSLYRSFGFEELARRRHYYGPDRHALTMRRWLRLPMGSQPLGGDGGH